MGSNVELQTVLASAAAPEPGKIQKAKPEATPLPSLQSDGLSLSGSFYTGSSAGFLVNWTARDLSSAPERNSSRPTFSLRSVSEADYAAPVEGYSPGEDEETSVEETSVVARLCSVIGHTLSFQTESVGYTERAAHPWANSTLQTIDMRTGKPIELTDLFPQEVLYKALLRDKVVKRALGSTKPKNFHDLVKVLESIDDPQGRFRFSRQMFQHFAFHHVEGNKVAVRLALPCGAEAFRGTMTQLGLLLPIPGQMRSEFTAAKNRTAGILWGDLARSTRGKQTEMLFHRGN